MLCESDSGNECEFYGNLKFQIGDLPDNQDKVVWARADSLYVTSPVGVIFSVLFSLNFDEYETFATNGDKYVLLDGKIKEKDTNSGDLIADFKGQQFKVTNIFGKNQAKRVSSTSNNDFAEVKVMISKV